PSCSINSPRDPKFTKDLYTLFRQIRKLPDISPEHLESLNVSLEYDVPLEKLIPSPPPAPEKPTGDEAAETFAERKRELLVPNQHAFETLARTRRDIKLGHFYRFYQSLELVSAYYKPTGAFLGMPEKFREDLVKNFVESLCWGYNARLLPPRGPPRVQFQTSRFTTRIDFFAYVTPSLPAERKAGLVEGPLFAIQCRHDDYFVSPGEISSEEDSASEDAPDTTGSWAEGDVWDTLKEVGALLCTAQERRKGGKNDGGIGKGKVVNKVRYRAIGRDGTWWDEIFLLSAVHSHVALTRVRISSAYLRFLETANLPNPEHELIKDEKSGWCELKIQRSRWFNLMEPLDRVESARMISAAMGYLERNEGSA
ncbi:hypothetical protein DFH27DRAFT_638341, partial [Peziza echinospora]